MTLWFPLYYFRFLAQRIEGVLEGRLIEFNSYILKKYVLLSKESVRGFRESFYRFLKLEGCLKKISLVDYP